MRLLKTITLLFTVVAFTAFTADQQETKLENSLLWKIEKKGMEPSYLFGTIHLISQEQFYLPEKVTDAINACDKLMLEIDVTDQAQMMSMLELAVMADGKTMNDLLSPEDYSILDTAIMFELGVGLQLFNNYKPFVLESFLITKVIEGEPASYEMELAKLAQDNGMGILQLESVAKQMAIFDEIPYEEQAKDLMRYARGDEDMKQEFATMVDLYLKEDLNGLYNYMDAYYTEDIWMQKLLVERNAAWIPIIAEKVAAKPTFIAVGAGHLGGETGVIKRLRKAGYKVTAVMEKESEEIND